MVVKGSFLRLFFCYFASNLVYYTLYNNEKEAI